MLDQSLEVLQFIMAQDNLAEVMDQKQLDRIGMDVVEDYKLDKASMTDWLARMERGIELATLVKEDKTYPFKGAANVKYPLITTAALQFNARAYPAIVAADGVVKVRTYGADPGGHKARRAERVAAHMSWQLTAEMEEWEEDTDKLLTQLPIVGTMIRKVWFDPVEGRQRCRLVEAGKFIVNDKVRNLADAPRCTEEMSLYPDEIESRIRAGSYRRDDYTENDSEDRHAPEDFVEQHCRMDLDEDGYEEPYIVTVHVKSNKVARIVADFEAEDVRLGPEGVVAIHNGSYFVSYQFLPSMDGGFWGTGFGLLLGDISSTINSVINMMMDAGHYASLGGGFLGKEFRIKGGGNGFKPGEWKTAPAAGADIKSAIVPLTFPGPDATLFQLLGLLIDAGKEVSSTQDIMTGDTGQQNMTATTTLALIEQGLMVFTAAYKRIFRSLKKEYRIIAKTNARTVSPEVYNAFHDEVGPDGQPVMVDPARDYNVADMDIMPVADPRSVTKMQEAAKAQIVFEMAQQGMLDMNAAAQRVLESMQIPDVEELAPKPNPVQEYMAELGVKDAELTLTMKQIDSEKTKMEIAELRTKAMKNLSDAEANDNDAKLRLLEIRLQAINDGIDGLVARRMERQPGHDGSAGMRQGQSEDAERRRVVSLLERQGMAGGQPRGFGPGGGVV